MFRKKVIEEDLEIEYARSRLLGVFSYFNIGQKDSAVLWSALNYLDKYKSEAINIKDFASTFCPKSAKLLEKIFEKYTYKPKERAFKASQDVPTADDEDDVTLGMDANQLMEHMAKSEKEMEAAKAKYEEEMKKKREKDIRERLRPDYVKFLCFLLFFMTIPEQDMPLFIYWLWYSLPKVKATKENIHGLTAKLWDNENFNFNWYDGEVKYIVKVVDISFNARTFQLTDQRCGGAWSIPFHELRAEIYHNLENELFFKRISTGFLHGLEHPEVSMIKLKDLKLKGAPDDHTSKGDRSNARHEIRAFIHHYRSYINQPQDEIEVFAEGNCCKTLYVLFAECMKKIFRPCIDVWKAIAPEEVDLSMGMGTEGYARPKSRGTLAKIKSEMESSDSSTKKALTPEEIEMEEMLLAKQRQEEEKKRLVPMEYKYRKQLDLPPRVLNHKAKLMIEDGQKMIQRVKTEVVDDLTILANYDMRYVIEIALIHSFTHSLTHSLTQSQFMNTNIDIDPLDDNDDDNVFNTNNMKNEDESVSTVNASLFD